MTLIHGFASCQKEDDAIDRTMQETAVRGATKVETLRGKAHDLHCVTDDTCKI